MEILISRADHWISYGPGACGSRINYQSLDGAFSKFEVPSGLLGYLDSGEGGVYERIVEGTPLQ